MIDQYDQEITYRICKYDPLDDERPVWLDVLVRPENYDLSV